jgi:mono/diheme cytochrome c family protein
VISLFTYNVIKIDWVSIMEIQSSFKPMEDPLPVPSDSIPVEGAAYTAGMGVQVNPVAADEVSIQRGLELYRINCVPCHGKQGKGDGVVGTFFTNKPADLTSEYVQQFTDGAIFMTITDGVSDRMPPLNENLTVRERWDLVNFIFALPNLFTPTPTP